MSYSRLSMAAIAASLLACQASADSVPSPPPAADGGRGSAMHSAFTREERMMLFADFFKATAAMTDDQKQAYREQERARIRSMSDADRANFKAELDSRWNGLSPDQKAAMTARVQSFVAARHAGQLAR
jgi:hypothetical protein